MQPYENSYQSSYISPRDIIGIKQPVEKKNNHPYYLHIHARTLPTPHQYGVQAGDLYDYTIPVYQSKVRIDLFNLSLNPKYLFFHRIMINSSKQQCIVIEKRNLKKTKCPLIQQGNFLFRTQIIKKQDKYFLKFALPFEINEKYVKNQQENYSNYFRNDEQQKQQNIKYLDHVFQIVRMTFIQQNRGTNQKGVKLKQGQILKMGKSLYKIVSIQFGKEKQNIIQQISEKNISSNEQTYQYKPIQPKKKNSQTICRICLSGDQPSVIDDRVDFLINPCKCKGSAMYIHFLCLQEWMKNRVIRNQSQGAIQFNFKRYECQLCKTPYPRYFRFNNKLIQLVPVNRPQGEHIMFEGLNDDSNSLIILQNFYQPIKMGRNFTSNVIMTEMSVSRSHASIYKRSDGFYIIDEISKFGTLIYQPNLQIQLSENRRAIQIGHSSIAFDLRKGNTIPQIPQIAYSMR